MDWNKLQQLSHNGWVIAPVVFALWLIGALIVKRSLFGRLRAAASREPGKNFEILIEFLNFPINLVILFASLVLMAEIVPVGAKVAGHVVLGSKLILILGTILIADRAVRGLTLAYDRRAGSTILSKGLLLGLMRSAVFIIGGIILLDESGVRITPLIASLGVGTLAVALALQTTLSNLFSGIFLTLDKFINPGDYVKLQSGEIGRIEDIGARTSRLLLPSGGRLIISNTKLIDNVLVNYNTAGREVSFDVSCAAPRNTDPEAIERAALETAREVMAEMDEAVKTFDPVFRFTSFDAETINFTVTLRCGEYPGQSHMKHEFIKRLLTRIG